MSLEISREDRGRSALLPFLDPGVPIGVTGGVVP